MNYKSLSINERINFKSHRLSAGPKLFKEDVAGFWDSDFMHLAKQCGEEPYRR